MKIRNINQRARISLNELSRGQSFHLPGNDDVFVKVRIAMHQDGIARAVNVETWEVFSFSGEIRVIPVTFADLEVVDEG